MYGDRPVWLTVKGEGALSFLPQSTAAVILDPTKEGFWDYIYELDARTSETIDQQSKIVLCYSLYLNACNQ